MPLEKLVQVEEMEIPTIELLKSLGGLYISILLVCSYMALLWGSREIWKTLMKRFELYRRRVRLWPFYGYMLSLLENYFTVYALLLAFDVVALTSVYMVYSIWLSWVAWPSPIVLLVEG